MVKLIKDLAQALYLNIKYSLGIRSQLLHAALLRNNIRILQQTMKKLGYKYRLKIGVNDLEVEVDGQWFVPLSNKFFKLSDGNQTSLFPAVANPKVIVDGGAFIGEYTSYFAKKYPGATVYAIEPSPTNYGYLQKNLKMNHLTNVKTFNVALSNKIGEADFTDDASSSKVGQGNTKVQTITLKKFVADNNITTIDFLKLDIEGYEPLLIDDLDELLSQGGIKHLVVEMGRVAPLPEYDALVKMFAKHGFKTEKLQGSNYWVSK